MRVLMVCPELPSADRPGSMAPALRQFESLKTLGVDVTTYDMRGTPVLKYLFAIPRIRNRARRVDIVHSHFGFCGWLVYLATLFMRGRPRRVMSYMGDDLLGTPYNEDGDLERFSRVMVRLNKWLAHKFDQVIVKSCEMQEVLAPTPSTVVPNGVDIDTFRPTERNRAREILGLRRHGHYVLFPGNPENPRKGYRLAAAAVEEAARTLGQSIEILTLWRVPPERVPVYMSAVDAMTMTSLIEGSPNVVKEAMACNTPVVSVPVGDTREMLKGVDGCSVCQRDSNALSAGIVSAIQSGSSSGREAIASRKLQLLSVARQVLAIYQSTLGSSFERQEVSDSGVGDFEAARSLVGEQSSGETVRDSNSMEVV